jgi:D-alanine-D-alanine ligase
MSDFNNSVKTSYHDSVYLYTDGFKLKEETTKRDCDTIIKYLELKPGDCILDLACGHGRHSLELAQRNLGSLVGLDISSQALEIARNNANQQGLTSLRFEQGDLRTMVLLGRFDPFGCITADL